MTTPDEAPSPTPYTDLREGDIVRVYSPDSWPTGREARVERTYHSPVMNRAMAILNVKQQFSTPVNFVAVEGTDRLVLVKPATERFVSFTVHVGMDAHQFPYEGSDEALFMLVDLVNRPDFIQAVDDLLTSYLPKEWHPALTAPVDFFVEPDTYPRERTESAF